MRVEGLAGSAAIQRSGIAASPPLPSASSPTRGEEQVNNSQSRSSDSDDGRNGSGAGISPSPHAGEGLGEGAPFSWAGSAPIQRRGIAASPLLPSVSSPARGEERVNNSQSRSSDSNDGRNGSGAGISPSPHAGEGLGRGGASQFGRECSRFNGAALPPPLSCLRHPLPQGERSRSTTAKAEEKARAKAAALSHRSAAVRYSDPAPRGLRSHRHACA